MAQSAATMKMLDVVPAATVYCRLAVLPSPATTQPFWSDGMLPVTEMPVGVMLRMRSGVASSTRPMTSVSVSPTLTTGSGEAGTGTNTLPFIFIEKPSTW